VWKHWGIIGGKPRKKIRIANSESLGARIEMERGGWGNWVKVKRQERWKTSNPDLFNLPTSALVLSD
jgi:hypothetical protein